jgi:hypothetical protein
MIGSETLLSYRDAALLRLRAECPNRRPMIAGHNYNMQPAAAGVSTV